MAKGNRGHDFDIEKRKSLMMPLDIDSDKLSRAYLHSS